MTHFRITKRQFYTGFPLYILVTLGILRYIQDSIILFPFLTALSTIYLVFPTKRCTMIDETTKLQNGKSTVKTQLYLLAISGWVT